MKQKNLSAVEKLNYTPFERGFACMEPESCANCIKAASLIGDTTPCEDELESEKPWPRRRLGRKTFASGIYSTEHLGQPDETKKHRVFRAWLHLRSGGVLGIPYPAKTEAIAKIRANNACHCFDGELIELEDLGLINLKEY